LYDKFMLYNNAILTTSVLGDIILNFLVLFF